MESAPDRVPEDSPEETPEETLEETLEETPENSSPGTRTWIKVAVPLAILAVGALSTIALVKARPEVETVETPAPLPLVRVMKVAPRQVPLDVTSQGTVLPRTETTLISEVAGRIVAVSPSFANGGFFEQGEVLARIDERDYRLAVTQAEAEVARAEVLLSRERAEAEVAVEEWRELGLDVEPSALATREAQVAEARAAVAAAQAALERTRIALDRTAIRAPFAGRVRQKQADLGQYVAPGQPLGRVYAVDYAEVRLPVPDDQLAFLDLPIAYRRQAAAEGPPVTLEATFAGRRHRWQGTVVRTEGEVDPVSRMVHLVARVDDPYGRGDDPGRPPLAVGMFVEARIEGRNAGGLVPLPRSALRGEGRVMVYERDTDTEGRLRFRDVEVLRTLGDTALVAKGLEDAEEVCVSPLETAVDGMRVRAVPEAASSPEVAP